MYLQYLFQKVDEGAVAGFGSYEYEVVYQASPKGDSVICME